MQASLLSAVELCVHDIMIKWDPSDPWATAKPAALKSVCHYSVGCPCIFMRHSEVLLMQVESCENQLRQLELTSQQLLQVSANQVSAMLAASTLWLAGHLYSVHMHGLHSKVPQQTGIDKPCGGSC